MAKSAWPKVILIDSLLVGYLLVVLDRILLGHYFPSEFSWGCFGFVFGFGALGGGVWSLTGHSLGAKLFGLVKQEPNGVWNGLRILFLMSIVIGTLIIGLFITRFSFRDLLNIEGLRGAGRIFSAIFRPQWSILSEVLFAMIETVYIAVISTIIAIPLAFILSFPAAKNIMGKNRTNYVIYLVLRGAINFFRSVEPLIWAIIFSVWVGIGPFAGMLALMFNSIVGLIKLYSEQIENIDDGLVLAIGSTGASRFQMVWFAVVPQIVLPFLAFTIYRWDLNVRMATVIGLVGGGGIGTLLMQYQGLAKWNEVGLIILVISIVVWIIDYSSAKIREIIR